jgi:hypothetical protein
VLEYMAEWFRELRRSFYAKMYVKLILARQDFQIVFGPRFDATFTKWIDFWERKYWERMNAEVSK